MTSRRLRRLAGLLALAVTAGLGACTEPLPSSPAAAGVAATPSGASASSAGPSSAAPSAAPDLQAGVDRLFAAGVVGDRNVWDAGVAALDAAFVARSTMLFDNLRVLRPTRLRLRLTGAEQQLSTARAASLGAGAHVVQAELGWRLPGEDTDATSTVWLTLVPGPDGVRLAGTDDGMLDTSPLPLWWLAPVTRSSRGGVTVLVGPGQSAERWVGLARRAAADARAHLPTVLRTAWDGHLVVEVPGSAGDFGRVLGARPSAYATTAAVTRPEGPTTEAAVRVVVNPATAGESDAELGTTLTHETVHVATRSASSPAPLWAVEGLAEYVALEAHPDQRDDELAVLRGTTVPERLPADDAFAAGGAGVGRAYAQAWLACRAVAAHRGRDDLGELYAALDEGEPVEEAVRSTLHTRRADVVRWWRDTLGDAVAAGG